MNLNHDCVRDLMLSFEDVPYGETPTMEYFIKLKRLASYTNEDILYCTEKLLEANYIELHRIKAWGLPFDGIFRGITWEGHQFLDSVRSDTVWNKSKEKIKETVGSASIQILSALASSITARMLGL